MKKIPPEARNIAILLKMIGDDPTLVDYLNEDNLLDLISLKLYDDTKLEITPRGHKLISKALPELEEKTWTGEFSSEKNPTELSPSEQKRVSAKIRKLIREGYPVSQAAAIAFGIARQRAGGSQAAPGKRNPKVATYKGWEIYEIKPQASLGYYKSGRGGKVIKGGKKYFTVVPPEMLHGKVATHDAKNISEAKRLIDTLIDNLASGWPGDFGSNPMNKEDWDDLFSNYFEEVS